MCKTVILNIEASSSQNIGHRCWRRTVLEKDTTVPEAQPIHQNPTCMLLPTNQQIRLWEKEKLLTSSEYELSEHKGQEAPFPSYDK